MSGLDFVDASFRLHRRGGHVVNFQAARQDQTGTVNVQYVGWIANDGAHIIIKRDLTDTTDVTTKYFYGNGKTVSFLTNWGNRTTTIVYVEYNALFS